MNEEVEKLRRKLQDLEEQHTTGFVNDAQYAEFRALLERRLVEAVMTSPMPLDALPPAPPPAAQTPALPAPRSRRRLVGAAVATVAGVAGLGAWLAMRRTPGATVTATGPAATPGPGSGAATVIAPAAEAVPGARTMTAPSHVGGSKAGASETPTAESPSHGAGASGRVIEGTVSIAAALASKASPGDTVFVYARAVEGPPMPLALTRAQVRDLPLRFRFDDSMGLWTSAKLSSFPRVVIAARVSRRGDASPQPGDLQGQSAPVPVGSTAVQVTIDSQLP